MPPSRTPEQRTIALELANKTRLYRAALKRSIKTGATSAADVIADNHPLTATMKVYDVLLAVPRVGEFKARRLLALEQVSEVKTVGGLSPRQRGRLMEMFASGRPVTLPEANELIRVPGHWKRVAA